ncbi:MAG: FliA/WhiG family RNA polymerase sigma factor [Candidatus Wallbacteria bacterium]|nr:FliA/WhiG family RNA polymerase sigma factor [Candidatus Wallbacteria bacterium]
MNENIIDQKELFTAYKETRDPLLKEKIIRRYAPLVKFVAMRLAMNLPPSVDVNDLISYGIFGLLDAIEKFSLEFNVKFETYAKKRIRGSILDAIRKLDWAPRLVRSRTRQLEKTITALEMKLGRPPKEEEIAKEMGIAVEEFQEYVNDTRKSLILSLEEFSYEGDGESQSNSDRLKFFVDSQNAGPEEEAFRRDIKRLILAELEKLTPQEKLVVSLYYFKELTLKEIAKIMNLSEGRISQMHTQAILKLRSRLTGNKKDLLEG